jgi:hypothetical protein
LRLTGKTSLRSLSRHLKGVPAGAPVVVALSDLDRHHAALRRAGFSEELGEGETILPGPVGKTSLYNAEGRYIVHKDQPKETVYRQQEWTWEEWHGPYTVTQSRIVDVPYERYPRTFVEPPSVELTVAKDLSGDKVVVCEALDYSPTNEEALLHRINLFRELFGECDLLTGDLSPFIGTKLRRLNWEVLPQGELPWERLKQRLDLILKQLGERKGPVAEHRLKILTEDHKPAFTAVGRAGFRGYLVFGFKDKRVFILESLHYGNATYVFDEDWERLSQMTKAEILAGNRQKDRIIHREGWDAAVRRCLR